ncbi:MAG: RNA-binding S4 domain-containing protein [Clostridia bacterium]|nr:RNA-binding S4 domain-containing protein [Clostridia bacterium]
MRLDKYLKVSRLIKRRTVANDACDGEHISVNGKRAKASYQVKEGDIISISYGEKTVSVKVLGIKESTKKADAAEMYEVVDE